MEIDDVQIELEALERAGWDALCGAAGGAFYGGLMTDDGLMVLADGTAMSREQVTAALDEAPPWASYEIDDLRVVELGESGAALVYRGTARRDDGPEFTALMTSVYVKDGQAWRLALYTQTPVPA